MIKVIVFAGIFIIFIVGYFIVKKKQSVLEKNDIFVKEYHNKFIDFANIYAKSYDSWNKSGNIDPDLYRWLTLNVSKIQNIIGSFGVMSYRPALGNHYLHNYQIIINTIPKFRSGTVMIIDIETVEDSLLRYAGDLEENKRENSRKLKNPIIWFREGFREILSIPLLILNWFGVFTENRVDKITESLLYKTIAGVFAFVTFASGLVTIIVGYESVINFIHKLMAK
ncbi:MAG TPA: hypothetical protein PLW78_08205 [bacterium]|nr:hypothetical protein [bacterium]